MTDFVTVNARNARNANEIFRPKAFGRQERSKGCGTTLTSFINSRAVLRGATIDWNKERLINGKLNQYQRIGGEPLTLKSRIGDKISAFHFEVKNFFKSLTDMGGKPVNLEIQLNHPFFDRAQPVKLSSPKARFGDTEGVCISYSKELESEFKNPKDFLVFCQKMGYELYWKNTMAPFQLSSWWHFNSMKQNLILIPKTGASNLKIATNPEDITIQNTKEFGMSFFFMDKGSIQSPAIVFEDNLNEVESLFTSGSLEARGLKIENSSWNMIRHEGKLYFVANPHIEAALTLVERKGLSGVASYHLSERPVLHPQLDKERATVVLSMNQTNSFASYSHEVLTFLFAGVNVLAYDNAGKGLSEGSNSQQGMTEAIRAAGNYLIKRKGLRQNQIIFKGQCAGGLPSSEAAIMFPASHVWVDQAPQTFSGAAKGIALKKAEKAAKSDERSRLKTFSRCVPFIAPVISGVTSLVLPNYDVVKNLRKNYGIQIYTIGVPDKRGYGGDEMVPDWEHDNMKNAVRLNPMGYYLTITGGTHVTDWWTDQNVAQSVDQIFKQFKLSANVFPETPTSAEDFFATFFEKDYDALRATSNEESIYQIFKAVENQDLDKIKQIMFWEDAKTPWNSLGLYNRLSEGQVRQLRSDMISLSRRLGNRDFTVKLMMAQRNGEA